jgi:ABC-type sugar transport system substrate-binding protein
VKRVLVLLLGVVAIALVVAACGGGDSDSSDAVETTEAPAEATTEAAPETTDTGAADTGTADTGAAAETTAASDLEKIPSLEGKTIAYIQTGSVEYFDSSMNGAKAAVEALGGNLVVYNSEFDPAKELDNVRTAITEGVDGILLFSVSRGALESSARLAKEAGIPVANYYGYVEGIDPELVDFWTGANPYDIGTLDGQAMAELLNEGDEVAAVQGVLGRGEVEEYQRGFEEQLQAKNITVVDKPTSNWSRQEALARARELLVKYPDLKGLYCHNDDTSVGCVNALKDAGKQPGDIKMVTLNGSPTGIQLMEEGWLQADVTQPPPLESALAVRALAQILGGVEVDYPVPCYTPISLITPDDLDDLSPLVSWEPTDTELALVTPCANQTGDIFGG